MTEQERLAEGLFRKAAHYRKERPDLTLSQVADIKDGIDWYDTAPHNGRTTSVTADQLRKVA